LFEDVVKKVLIIIALVMLIVSVAGLYMALNAVIDVFIGYKYAPIYKVLLNLAILVLAIYVLKILIYERRDTESSAGKE
jgi:VanZ family protein